MFELYSISGHLVSEIRLPQNKLKNNKIMRELKPTCNPNGVYSVKRTCAELGISHKTLRKYRENGYIEPVNPNNIHRPKYSGKSIIDCWEKLIRL